MNSQFSHRVKFDDDNVPKFQPHDSHHQSSSHQHQYPSTATANFHYDLAPQQQSFYGGSSTYRSQKTLQPQIEVYGSSNHGGYMGEQMISPHSPMKQSDFDFEMTRRSPSPIRDMNYFDGINAIREEQNAFYEQLIASQKEQKDFTSQIV